jgi:sugar lactone lactonase YvrE
MRRTIAALCALASLVFVAAAAAATFPSRIELPDGWRPEGIAAGQGNTLYVGSIGTGAVRRVNARTGDSSTLVRARDGRAAIGLEAVGRRLFVAGGPTGKAFVYSTRTGGAVADFQLAPEGVDDTFVNDVAVTDDAAYFTDSRRSVLYVLPRDLSAPRELPLPDIPLLEENNLNGIVATPDGGTLIAVQSNAGVLWNIDADTGRATRIDLGGASVTNGDGLLLRGRLLYVVRNRLNRIAVFRLNADRTAGSRVRTLTARSFDVPTTIARQNGRLYAVNARFDNEPTEDTGYWITKVRDEG